MSPYLPCVCISGRFTRNWIKALEKDHRWKLLSNPGFRCFSNTAEVKLASKFKIFSNLQLSFDSKPKMEQIKVWLFWRELILSYCWAASSSENFKFPSIDLISNEAEIEVFRDIQRFELNVVDAIKTFYELFSLRNHLDKLPLKTFLGIVIT